MRGKGIKGIKKRILPQTTAETWDFKQGKYLSVCCTCLNFIENAKGRGFYIGECQCYGVTISAFDKCGSWQDDA